MKQEAKKSLEPFFKQAAADPVLNEKLAALDREYRISISALAKEAGFELSPEGMAQEMQSLTDEEMKNVSGGWSPAAFGSYCETPYEAYIRGKKERGEM